MIYLPRGGYYVNTRSGPVQFGLPPETIKDSMKLGLTLPTIFVLPKERFNLQMGMNVGEFEFPAYFSFFVKRKKVTLIVERNVEPLVRTIFRETLLGPQNVQMPGIKQSLHTFTDLLFSYQFLYIILLPVSIIIC